MKAAAVVAAAVVVLGCSGGKPAAPAAPPSRTVAATAVPLGGLWIGLRAQGENTAPVGHAPSVPWVPIAHLADEGAQVQVGGELIRFDAEQLQTDIDRDAFTVQQEDQNRRLDLLRAAGSIDDLESRLRQLAASRRAAAAELASASDIDPLQVRIAELNLADARATLAAAVRRRERMERIAAAGAAIPAAELASARGDEIRAGAAMAAPAAALEVARLPASSAAVRQLRIAVADLDAQIGAGDVDGIKADIRTAIERRHRRELDQGQERRRRGIAKRQELLADPVLRARAAGVVAFRNDEVRVGSKQPGMVSCALVLQADGMVARLEIPERMRSLVRVGAEVAIDVPGARTLRGSVATIAAAPEDGRDGSRHFPALVAFAAAPAGLSPGMRLDARLLVAVPGSPAVVPSFCVAGGDRPTLTLADGTVRNLEGWSYAGSFVALAGLAPGELVRVPEQAPPPGRLRLSALVEPAAAEPVRLRSWGWEPSELLPEGSRVVRGQRLARLIKTDYWRNPDDIRADAELALARSRLDLVVAQLDATDDQAHARSDWARAILASGKAGLAAWLARAAWDPIAEAAAAAAVSTAEVELDRARRDLAATRAERRAGSASESVLRAAELAEAHAVSGLDRARLEAAAQELAADWLALRAKDDAVLAARADELAKRDSLLIAAEQHRGKLAAALSGVESTKRWVEASLLALADEEVVAPADGILVYVRGGDGPPRIGRQLSTMEPFRIATGSGRRATFDLPARLFGRIKVGDRVQLHGDGHGDSVAAEVLTVATAFLPPRDLADELALGRTVGQADGIFQATLAFAPPDGDPARLAYGATVYGEF